MAEDALVRARFDPTAQRSVSVTVVETLTLVTGRSLDLPPLAECVDTDALDALFSPRFGSPPAADVQLSFPYERWLVTISGDGEIVVSVRPDVEVSTD